MVEKKNCVYYIIHIFISILLSCHTCISVVMFHYYHTFILQYGIVYYIYYTFDFQKLFIKKKGLLYRCLASRTCVVFFFLTNFADCKQSKFSN